MTTDEGTPKRRRGLFRRDRGNAAATDDERRGADTFDDPWSASAWDDWDDDFTNGGARSSVPAAAAPRPEAVDAWLKSEADDFDTATRRNTMRWGGDANRSSDTASAGLRSMRAETEATVESNTTVLVPGSLGLGALREGDSTTSAPLPFPIPDAAETHADPSNADLTGHVAADWASDPDLLVIDEISRGAEISSLAEISELAEGASADAVAEPVSPIWEPVEALAPDLPDPPDPLPQEIVDRAAAAAAELPGSEDELAPLPTVSTTDDELVLTDAIEPEQLELDDLTALDEQPTTLTPHRASWAPNVDEPAGPVTHPLTDKLLDSRNDPVRDDASESTAAPIANIIADTPPDEPFVAAEEVRIRLPGLADPLVPQPPPSRFVTVSVVGDDDEADAVSSPHQPTTETVVGAEASFGDGPGAPSTLTPHDAVVTPRQTPLPFDTTAPSEELSTDATGPRIAAAPTITSRRWAALAAEFSSDGDLDDSFPSRTRPATPPPTVGAAVTTVDDAASHAVDVVEAATHLGAVADTIGDPGAGLVEPIIDIAPVIADSLPVEPELVVAVPTTSDSESIAGGGPTIDAGAAAEPAKATPEPDTDPWAKPLVRRARPDALVSGPPSTRKRAASLTSAEDDPWTRPPQRSERQPAAVRAAGPASPDVATDLPSKRQPLRPAAARPTPDRGSLSRTLEPARIVDDGVSEDISSFAGYVGTALVGLAIVRIVLTLLGDQPVIPARYTGREASLLRIGESFGSAGSAWPVALVVGTILLTVPGFLAVRSHLRRWAPIVGLAATTGVVAVAIGALRFVAGRRLGSATTIKLISDVVVGPVGFGLLTLVVVGLAIRTHRR